MGADWKLTRKAAQFKAVKKIAYADCYAAALAEDLGATIVTGDPEFSQIEGEVSITWL